MQRLFGLLFLILCMACGGGAPPPGQSTEERREAAYRANNRGVALLEQFAHESAAAAFRQALELDASLRLAQINLPLALFYAGMSEEAAAQATVAREKYPDAPQPPYLIGLIARSENRIDDAVRSFQRVLEIDPDDVGAKVNLALVYVQERRYAEAATLCESALATEPYNATAAYNLAVSLARSGNTQAGAQAMERFQELRTAAYAITYSQTYLEQGRYAEALASTGAEPDLVSTPSPAVSFVDATAAWLAAGATQPASGATPLPAPLGGGVTLVDLDADGDLDVVSAGPSVRVFRNDRTRLVEVTRELGLGGVGGPAFGAVAGDFNNDTRPDLLFLTIDGPRLFTQEQGGRFRALDVRAFQVGRQIARSAAFVDVDHDGDLDILIGDLTAQPPSRGSGTSNGWTFLRSARPSASRLLRNNGNGTFEDVTRTAGLQGVATVVAVAPTDFDNRRDIDLLMVSYGLRPKLFKNLRTGAFADVAPSVGLPDPGPYTSVALADINKDGFTDAFFGRESAPGIWAMSDGRGRFRLEDGLPSSRDAVAAQIFDYDNDGLLDVFVVTTGGPRLFRNMGRTWQDESGRAFPADLQQGLQSSGPVTAIASGDLDLDGDTDLVVQLQSGALRIWRNDGGNRNRSLRVVLNGRVSNRGGIGAKVEIRAGSLHQKVETASSTPPAVPSDIVFGIGSRREADVVRVLWPAGILQAETTLTGPAVSQAGLTILELDRKPSSCPYLYTWNGSRFEFITDFMGGGEMGYLHEPGVRNVPDPIEYVRMTDEQLRARDGKFEMRVTNELEEALFVDHLRLLSVTHPADVAIFPDEGLRAKERPLRLYATRHARAPAAAYDEHGHDVLPKISRMDRQYPDDFDLLPIRGYAREHTITLDMPPYENRNNGVRPRSVLLLTGWTDYAFSRDNMAAHQAGFSLSPPALQIKDDAGRWQTVDSDIGIPVGRPQTLVVDVTKFVARKGGSSDPPQLRIVTNMRIYWDQILVATAGGSEDPPLPENTSGGFVVGKGTSVGPPLSENRSGGFVVGKGGSSAFAEASADRRSLGGGRLDPPWRIDAVPRLSANLRRRGFSAEVTPDGREPFGYDYARVLLESPWKLMPGRYTREGDVAELIAAADDRFVVSRPGDELALSFDAAALAPLPNGMRRTFLLHSVGYSKEMDLHSASPDEAAPIPFRAMSRYPYTWPERYPHEEDLDRFHTRVISRSIPPLPNIDYSDARVR